MPWAWEVSKKKERGTGEKLAGPDKLKFIQAHIQG